MTTLSLHDPVHITTQSPNLEGIILHYGTVSFASGIWIGVRLTGSSVGKGKNDGSVEGVQYFDAPEKGGLFMKETKALEGGLEKRSLTKLEGLRLKREVGDLKAADGSGGGGKTRTSIGGKSTVPPVRTRSRNSVETSSAEAKSGGDERVSDRVKELRARREALAKERMSASTPHKDEGKVNASQSASPKDIDNTADDGDDIDNSKQIDESKHTTEEIQETTTVNVSHATPGYRAELTRLQTIITNLKSELQKKETENASLQSSLDFMSKGAEQSTHDAVRMYALGALALSETKSPSARSRTPVTDGRATTKAKTPVEESARRLKDEFVEEGSENGSGSDDESGDEEGDNDQVINQAAAAVSKALVDKNDELKNQLSTMASKRTELEQELSESQEKIANLTNKLQALVDKFEHEKQSRLKEQQSFTAERSTLSSQLERLQREHSVLQERAMDKSENDSAASAAKVKADLTILQRKYIDLENEKLDMEATLEELVLDKEALKEENEMITDQLEEMKIDLESTQLELEDARGQLQSGSAVDAEAVDGAATEGSDSDAARSLALHNTRLRTAILRLREQSEQEKIELQKQLKILQSDATSKEALQTELDELKATHATATIEVQELKDIVDQTVSLEETIETLSDKVWKLEQENANLERTVKELEESAEIAAEMEEVQSEELKCVMRDLEGKDALIRNLEEAIRMQRRREEDFQRYVSDFRSSISTLKQEKAALLALTEGEQGSKSELIASSQKALAQAAHLAANASAARKLESNAVFDRITARSTMYLCERIESLLPSGVASAEVAAVKGEIYLSKIVDKSAVSLSAIEEVFDKAIEKGVLASSEFNIVEEGADLVLSDESVQQIATMIHQTDFAGTVIETASDTLHFMAAGQWPELISEELSADLGSVAVLSVSQLDVVLSEQLKLLKEEGMLSPLRSSLSELKKLAQNAKVALISASDQSGNPIIPTGWKPPGLDALTALSTGRFLCLGATAVLASAICSTEDSGDEPPTPTLANLAGVLENAKQSCSSVSDACRKFAGLRLDDVETIESLDELASKYHTNSFELFNCVREVFTQQSISFDDVKKCSSSLEDVLTIVRQLSALLCKADLSSNDSTSFHELSPEFEDSWGGLANIVAKVRAIDGDPEDINYLMRARAIEQQLTDALQNVPELEKANTKVASLEKILASRSKEITLQNSRISELENLIAKLSSNPMSPVKGVKTPSSPSTENRKLKEEVRVLQEAIDVMQQQADENEKEIRVLKDKSRTPRMAKQTSGRITPNKSSSVVELEATLSQFGSATKTNGIASSRDVMLESISLETALFRPALASATRAASYWKAQSMGSALSKLAPLCVQLKSNGMNDYNGEIISRCVEEVALARKEVRLAKAAFSIVDLSKTDVSSRSQLNEQIQKKRSAESRLHDAILLLVNQQSLKGSGQSSCAKDTIQSETLLGKVVVPCREDTGFVVSMNVSKAELRDFHSFLVR